MANRLLEAIQRTNAKVATLPKAQVDKLNKDLKTSWKDLVEYQNLQSQAHAMGKISLEEAHILYRIYGGENPSPAKWDKLSIGERVVGTKAAAELINMRMSTWQNPYVYMDARGVIHRTGEKKKAKKNPRFKFTRDFYIPKEAKVIARGPAEAIVYGHSLSGDRVIGLGFGGKRAKPDWHYIFKSIAQRDNYIQRWFQALKKREEEKAARRKPVAAKEQIYTPGKVVVFSWGYEQTNIDFFKIMRRSGQWVWLAPMGSDEVEQTGWMQGMVIPTRIMPGKKLLKRKVHVAYGKEIGIAIERYGWASLWNGKPVHYTAYANPIRHKKAGWFWGGQGPFESREKALQVQRAAYASGYKGHNPRRSLLKLNPKQALYQSFHGSPPQNTRQVKVPVPDGPMIAIGRAERIEYEPYGSSQHKRVRFYHDFGDTGSKRLSVRPILATDVKGENLFIIPQSSKYPHFTDRGIIG